MTVQYDPHHTTWEQDQNEVLKKINHIQEQLSQLATLTSYMFSNGNFAEEIEPIQELIKQLGKRIETC